MDIILPGTLTVDKLIYYTGKHAEIHKECVCSLTMENVLSCDAVDFLNDQIRCKIADPNNDLQTHKLYQDTLKDLKELIFCGCIKIEKCGHIFAAVPILFEIMTRCFKCPICRSGSSNVVDTTCIEKAPDNMNLNLWRILSIISRHVKIEQKKQEESENFLIAAQFQPLTFEEIVVSNRVPPLQTIIYLYSNSRPNPRERPTLVVQIDLHYSSDLNTSVINSNNDVNIVLDSGKC
mgnify:CR=1 FL=1